MQFESPKLTAMAVNSMSGQDFANMLDRAMIAAKGLALIAVACERRLAFSPKDKLIMRRVVDRCQLRHDSGGHCQGGPHAPTRGPQNCLSLGRAEGVRKLCEKPIEPAGIFR